jgi:WD40 repeat protein
MLINLNSRSHLRAHFKDELWGLACHPVQSCVATVGDEGTVRVWDVLRRSLLHMQVRESPVCWCILIARTYEHSCSRCQDIKAKARALAYSPDGAHLAVALYSGDLLVLSETLDTVIAQVGHNMY